MSPRNSNNGNSGLGSESRLSSRFAFRPRQFFNPSHLYTSIATKPRVFEASCFRAFQSSWCQSSLFPKLPGLGLAKTRANSAWVHPNIFFNARCELRVVCHVKTRHQTQSLTMLHGPEANGLNTSRTSKSPQCTPSVRTILCTTSTLLAPTSYPDLTPSRV